MLPRRRHPLLGAALVVGASKSAARHEMEKQAQRDNEARLVADCKKREEQERQIQTQLAIEEAIAKERLEAERKKREEEERQTQNQKAVEAAIARERSNLQVAPQIVNSTSGLDESKRVGPRYCPECGHACQHQDKFCVNCGNKLPVVEG